MRINAIALAGSICAAASAAMAEPLLLDFEDLTPDSIFALGDSFTTGGVTVTVNNDDLSLSPFGVLVEGDSASAGFSPTPSTELFIGSVRAVFSFTETYERFSFDFGDFGGAQSNLLALNGEEVEFDDFGSFLATSPIVGGVTITGTLDASGTHGVIFGEGSFDSISFVGAELFLDDLRLVPSPGAAAVFSLAALVAGTRRRR